MPSSTPELLQVAVGVVFSAAGEVLIARRAGHRHQGGLWEFPGGKIEPGEAPEAALARELAEEVGLQIHAATPLLDVQHDYPERTVLLRVFAVHEFSGEAHGREGQPVCWVRRDQLSAYAFPEANAPILQAVLAPDEETAGAQANAGVIDG